MKHTLDTADNCELLAETVAALTGCPHLQSVMILALIAGFASTH